MSGRSAAKISFETPGAKIIDCNGLWPLPGAQIGVSKSMRPQQGSGSGPQGCGQWFGQAVLRGCAVLLIGLSIAACTNGSKLLESQLPTSDAIDLSAKGKTPVANRQGNPKAQGGGQGSYELFTGQAVDGGAAGDLSSGARGIELTGDKYSINVEGAEINEVSKLVLSDTLGLNYILDSRVQGTVTLSSIRPMTRAQMLSAFEAALRLIGATLVHQGEIYKVIPLQEVLEGEMGTAQRAQPGAAAVPGFGVTVIPLRYIAPSNMLELLDSFIARSGSVRASNVGNMLLVRGSGEERQQLADVVLSFDVDWMKAQTASIAILANSKPPEIVSKLQSIFAQDSNMSGGNAIKAIPLERLNGVVIIANSRDKVRRALTWVGRLDRESTTETNYYVYNVQNGSAVSLAKILNATFLEKSGEDSLASQVDPGQEQASLSSGGQTGQDASGQESGGQDAGGGQTPQGKSNLQGADTAVPADKPSTDIPKPDLSSGTRITPNPETNTLVIRATPQVYAKILSTLKLIDKQAVQVLVNATIAEVSLNDNLQYGVQAYLKSHNVEIGFQASNTATSMTIAPKLPGLNFLIGSAADPRVVLEALSAVTNVKVVSSPSVVVLENESATIKVGNSVPITVQQQQSDTGNANIINSIEYRDAGVILKVKPRISANGVVTMTISQELSSVIDTQANATSATPTPSFSQRTVTSTVSVPSSQTVVLGGLISGMETRDKSSVPIVNKVPIFGDLIGHTQNAKSRNELIVFITPQVIQDGQDASRVSEELREKMRLLNSN